MSEPAGELDLGGCGVDHLGNGDCAGAEPYASHGVAAGGRGTRCSNGAGDARRPAMKALHLIRSIGNLVSRPGRARTGHPRVSFWLKAAQALALAVAVCFTLGAADPAS